MKVSTAQSFTDFLRGDVSVRVMDEDGSRIYKINSRDLKAIYDSIRHEILDDIERQLRFLESDTEDNE